MNLSIFCFLIVLAFSAQIAIWAPNQFSLVSITRKKFPAGFTFGAATAAYQVEGGVNEDGRGKSIWDTYSHKFGTVVDLSNGDTAIDDYNRYMEDVNILANLSVDAYRFSISWPRIFPGVDRVVNQKGIDHYNAVIDALIEKGIQPYVTLYHWDLPQTLEDEYGGWLSEKIIDDYLLYADTCFKAFGDRVKHWITLNEPYNFATQGFGGLGTQPPARCSVRIKCSAGDSSVEPYIVAHNALLAHASAVSLYRQKYKAQQGGIIGITLDTRWYEPLNQESEDDKQASKKALDFHLGWFLDPIIFGDYPATMRQLVGNRLPSFSSGNFNSVVLKGSFDFIGINHYTTYYVKDSKASYLSAAVHNINQDGQFDVAFERDGESIGPQSPGASWLYIVPWGFKSLLDYIRVHYNNPLVIITENGYADLNQSPLIPLHQALQDDKRIGYHHDYLVNLLLAINDGANVKGYFVWSLLDNWEWGLGFVPRFGMYFVDYVDHLQRIPKSSAKWYKYFLEN